ncbi:molybdopterin molybdotransferase MoeA [Treponema sp. J25]|uniref:molybdopterin molybdotransferase MoeA n=1 Tax=Treponema sp. J25 TaxID=2094121 RepID=UPI00104813E9|nr:molybdopterin molybdotransferase MoeA [Treponema sp. J25]TCW60493.1 hypothetical protein C5O22_11470 [Treponema sp. J25]
MNNALHPDEALNLLLDTIDRLTPTRQPSCEVLPLEETLGRVLPYPVYSPIDQPPFPKAAMDGYAHAAPEESSRPPSFRVVGTVGAGERFPRPLASGEAVRIMTGAPLPGGTVGVQRVEWTRLEGERVYFTRPETAPNRIEAGENGRTGELLLTPRILSSQDVGVLAAAGYRSVGVSKRPKVAIFSTGDEIKAPRFTVPQSDGMEEALLPSKAIGDLIQQATVELDGRYIYDSNGYQLTTHALSAGAQVQFLGILPDRPELLKARIAEALHDHDILILSGGVSMGDYDYLPRIVGDLGFTILFHGLAMRPGKPTLGAIRAGKLLFGLPGNPLSTFVNFEVLIRPVVYRLMGLHWEAPRVRGTLTEDLRRKGTDRVEFLPIWFDYEQQQVVPLPYHGSSMITVLAKANGLIRMDVGVSHLPKGAAVYVRPIRPFY